MAFDKIFEKAKENHLYVKVLQYPIQGRASYIWHEGILAEVKDTLYRKKQYQFISKRPTIKYYEDPSSSRPSFKITAKTPSKRYYKKLESIAQTDYDLKELVANKFKRTYPYIEITDGDVYVKETSEDVISHNMVRDFYNVFAIHLDLIDVIRRHSYWE